MFPDDEFSKKRRQRTPFDPFGFDEEFDRMFREMQRMMERAFRNYPQDRFEPGKSFVHGYNIHIGPDGKPHIQEFGNRPLKNPEGKPAISEEREPLTDIIEGDEDVAVTVEIPGVEKEDIDLNVTNANLEITVNTPQRKYHRNLALPCDVIPNTTKATYKNGVLDVSVKRKEKKTDGQGFKVSID